jgi:hypothetical protein
MEENTEKTGAGPENTDVKEPKAGDKTDSTTAKDAKTDSSPENVPWNKDPRFQEFIRDKKTLTAANEKLQKLLKANELDDPDDLEELVSKGKVVKGKLADLNQLDEIIEKANKLTQYEKYWAEQEEKKRREVEDPEQTIARLENALKTKSAKEQQKEYERLQAEQARKAIEEYDSGMKELAENNDIPKEIRPFYLKYLGVGNPANDINITDVKARKRLFAEAKKDFDDLEQAIIKKYRDGKSSIPKIGSAQTGGPEIAKTKLKLPDARRELHERFGT